MSRALRGGSQDEVLSKGFRLTITRKDLQTLNHLNWLNDEVRALLHHSGFCTSLSVNSSSILKRVLKSLLPELSKPMNFSVAEKISRFSPFQVINFYMNMLVERSKQPNLPSAYTFNTFFFPKLRSSGYSAVRRWTKKVDIFSVDIILVPVHLGVHWCLSVSS